jgi:hypothetical protein
MPCVFEMFTKLNTIFPPLEHGRRRGTLTPLSDSRIAAVSAEFPQVHGGTLFGRGPPPELRVSSAAAQAGTPVTVAVIARPFVRHSSLRQRSSALSSESRDFRWRWDTWRRASEWRRRFARQTRHVSARMRLTIPKRTASSNAFGRVCRADLA